jgi:hypothetical protein
MTRWSRGEATIRKLLTDRHLQQLTGEMTDGQAWLDKAARTLTTANTAVGQDPESALVLAYEAGRQVGTGLLATGTQTHRRRPPGRGPRDHRSVQRAIR